MKKLKDNKIAFILCKNDNLFFEECMMYLNALFVPQDYEVEVLAVSDAKTMAAGYNEGMHASDAKYKIYMHQDVFILNRNFIFDVLNIFQNDASIGMLGMIGGIDLPQNAVIVDAWNIGRTYASNYARTFDVVLAQNEGALCTQVDAVDGMLMITQYDLEWRDDLGFKWDFYDISQSMEFRRKGYKVCVPTQEKSWCLHDCGHSNLSNYDVNRELFLEEYFDFFREKYVPFYNREKILLEEELADKLKLFIEMGKVENAGTVLSELKKVSTRNTNIQYISNFCEIVDLENGAGIAKEKQFVCGESWEELLHKYNTVKFLLRRIENDIFSEEAMRMLQEFKEKNISKEAVKLIAVVAYRDLGKVNAVIHNIFE